MNKIDRAYLYHGCRDHFSNKMSLERESTDTFYHMDDLEEQYESENDWPLAPTLYKHMDIENSRPSGKE